MKICTECKGTGKDFLADPCEYCNRIGLLDDNGQVIEQHNPIAIAYKLGYETGYNKAEEEAQDNERFRDETDF
jgi:hypothetical protein